MSINDSNVEEEPMDCCSKGTTRIGVSYETKTKLKETKDVRESRLECQRCALGMTQALPRLSKNHCRGAIACRKRKNRDTTSDGDLQRVEKSSTSQKVYIAARTPTI